MTTIIEAMEAIKSPEMRALYAAGAMMAIAQFLRMLGEKGQEGYDAEDSLQQAMDAWEIYDRMLLESCTKGRLVMEARMIAKPPTA